MDLNAVLASAAKSDKPKSKSNVLGFNPDNQDVKEAVDTLCAASKEIAAQKVIASNAEADVIKAVAEFREGQQRKDGVYHSSVRVYGTEVDNSAQISFKNAYNKCMQTPETQDALKKVVGDDNYGKYFEEVIKITVKGSQLNDAGLKELIEMVGVENFARIFDVEQTIKPTKVFHENGLSELSDDQRDDLLDAGIKPNKASVKV